MSVRSFLSLRSHVNPFLIRASPLGFTPPTPLQSRFFASSSVLSRRDVEYRPDGHSKDFREQRRPWRSNRKEHHEKPKELKFGRNDKRKYSRESESELEKFIRERFDNTPQKNFDFDPTDFVSLPSESSPKSSKAFGDLGVSSRYLKILERKGFTTPTPIQAECIPALLRGDDVIGQAHTGSGKTVAFVLPTLQLLHEQKAQEDSERKSKFSSRFRPRTPIRALCLCPTRELAVQIQQVFKLFDERCGCAVGGQDARRQLPTIRSSSVLVATPGRLADFVNTGAVSLDQVSHLVVDETDRMLEMGFKDQLDFILDATPTDRQTMLFSATIPKGVKALAKGILNNPVEIDVTGNEVTVNNIEQMALSCRMADKFTKLVEILKVIFSQHQDPRVLIFCNMKRSVNTTTELLDLAGFQVQPLHGDLSFNARQYGLNDFKRGKVRTLVATDVAARGLDIKNISHVIAYELSQDPESHVHRIGRTARAGTSGVAISFMSRLNSEDKKRMKLIEQTLGTKLPNFSDARLKELCHKHSSE